MHKYKDYSPMILRLGVGIVFAIHGYQKFSMQGFEGVAGFFDSIGIPMAMFFAYVVTLLELVGGIALIVGILTRWVSGLLAINMIVAFFAVHLENGFYVSDGGYEFVLVLLAASLSLALSGAGHLSLDNLIKSRK